MVEGRRRPRTAPGRVVGETVADRYEAAARRIQEVRPLDRETAFALSEISAAIADLARGRQDATTLHNVAVRIRHLVDRADGAASVGEAGRTLLGACERLVAAAEECRVALEAGLYPAAAEEAGSALRRLRSAVERRDVR